jgi:hypothetical protein
VILKGKKIGFFEKTGLSYGTGIFLVGYFIFLLGMFNIKPSFLTVVVPLIVLTFVLYMGNRILGYSVGFSFPRKEALSLLGKIFLILLILKIALTFSLTIIKPEQTWDALERYGVIAKAAYFEGINTEFVRGFIENVPPIISLAQTYIFITIGKWYELLGKAIFPLFYLSLLFVFYANLRKYVSVNLGIIFTGFLGFLPFISYHATSGYYDLPQCFFYTISVIYLLRYIVSREDEAFKISLIFTLFNILIKRWGPYLFLVNMVLLAIACFDSNFIKKDKQIPLKKLALFIIIPLILSFPWYYFVGSHPFFAFSAAGGLLETTVEKSEAMPFLPSGGINKITVAFKQIYDRFFFRDTWNLLYFALIASMIFNFKQLFKRQYFYIFIAILLNVAIIYFYFISSPQAFKWLLDGTVLNRVAMYHVPLVLYFIALLFSQMNMPKARG